MPHGNAMLGKHQAAVAEHQAAVAEHQAAVAVARGPNETQTSFCHKALGAAGHKPGKEGVAHVVETGPVKGDR